MRITLNLPHIPNGATSASEKADVLRALRSCIKNIREYTQCDLVQQGQYFTFLLPKVFSPDANRMMSEAQMKASVLNAETLKALLVCLINIDIAYLKHNDVAPLLGGHSGVVYRRTQLWECIPALYQRGYGDCKSLTAAYIAELHMQGKKAKPVFRFRTRQDGNQDFHILVLTEDGWIDPSRILGMGADENAYFTQ